MSGKEQIAPQYASEERSLCLAFANTVDWRASDHPEETLHTYRDLVSWAQRADILAEKEAQHLIGLARRRSADGKAVLARATVLREVIYRVFSSIVRHRPVDEGDVRALNAELSAALTRRRVSASESGFAWRWAECEDELDRLLWPVAWAASDLLTSEDLHRVGQCADDRGCGWLFLDRSRNRSRRWCEMKDCGNRAKAKRHYHRVRKSREAPDSEHAKELFSSGL